MSKFKTGKQCKRVKNGKRCERSAMRGQEVCYSHGGNAPQNKAAAKRRLAERAIKTELERGKLTGKALIGTTDPLSELQKLTTELVYFKDQLVERVNALGDDITHFDAKNTEAARVVIDLYMRANKELTKTLDIALKHDIEGKKLALETAKAEMVAACLIRVLTALDLPRETAEQAKALLAVEFEKIGA